MQTIWFWSTPADFSVSSRKLKRISIEFHNCAKHWSEEPTIPEPPETIPESPATIPKSPATIPKSPATIPEPPATIPDVPHHNQSETPKENKKLKKLKIKVGKATINSVDLL